MKKTKLYRYIGRNGIITSPVFLEGISHIQMYRLSAKPGFVLTDGEQFVNSIDIFEEDVELWTEVEAEQN